MSSTLPGYFLTRDGRALPGRFVLRFGALLRFWLIFPFLFIHFSPFCLAKVPKFPQESDC